VDIDNLLSRQIWKNQSGDDIFNFIRARFEKIYTCKFRTSMVFYLLFIKTIHAEYLNTLSTIALIQSVLKHPGNFRKQGNEPDPPKVGQAWFVIKEGITDIQQLDTICPAFQDSWVFQRPMDH
jgi:hypothetical protein